MARSTEFDRERRLLLKCLGSAAASLPIFSLLESSVARAQTQARPLRLLTLYSAHGGIWDNLRPKNVTGMEAVGFESPLASTQFDGGVLNGLKQHAARMVMLDGVTTAAGIQSTDYTSDATRIATRNSRWINHDNTAVEAFTGAYVGANAMNGSTQIPLGPSLDFDLGQRFGSDTTRRTIQLCTGSYDGADGSVISYDENGQRQSKVIDPAVAFTDLFAGVTGSSGGGMATVDAKKKRSTAIVAELQRQANSLRGRVGAADKLKLDSHLSALNDIASSLAAAPTTPMYPPVVCNSPTAPAANLDLNALPGATDAMFDILAQSFACDRVRFAAMSYGTKYETDNTFLYGKNVDMHGDVEHAIGDGDATVSSLARQRMQQWNTYLANKIGALMDRLAATPDGSGTLLDNTLIVWCTDFGTTTHDGISVPYLLLGGAQNKFRMGRYLKVGKTDTGSTGWKDQMPHNKLLVSIMQAYGVDTQTFGTTEFSGTVPNLT